GAGGVAGRGGAGMSGAGGIGGASSGAAGAAGSATGGAGGAGAGGSIGGAGGVAGGAGKAGNAGASGHGGGDGGMPRPIGITTDVTLAPTTVQSANGNGTGFSQTCAPNEVIIGMTGTVNDPNVNMNYLSTFQAMCGAVAISGTS